MKTLLIGSLNEVYDDEAVFINGLMKDKRIRIKINLGKVFYPFLPIYVLPKAIICSRVIIVTKLYTRPSLLLLCISLIVCKLCLCKVEVYIYPELFNYFGKFRSKLVGENLIKIFLSLCTKIWYSNDTTRKVISLYNNSSDMLYYYDHMLYISRKRLKIVNDMFIYNVNFTILDAISESELIDGLSFEYLCPNHSLVKNIGQEKVGIIRKIDLEKFVDSYSRARYVIKGLACDQRSIVSDSSIIICDRINNTSIAVTNDIDRAIHLLLSKCRKSLD